MRGTSGVAFVIRVYIGGESVWELCNFAKQQIKVIQFFQAVLHVYLNA